MSITALTTKALGVSESNYVLAWENLKINYCVKDINLTLAHRTTLIN